MTRALVLLSIVVVAACSPVRGFLESEFYLSSESELPPWYPSLPTGYKRREVDIRISVYTTILPVNNTVFTVSGKDGKLLYETSGQIKPHPQFKEWAEKDWQARSHPAYSILEVDAKRSVIEFRRMEPIFYIATEAAVQSLLGREYRHSAPNMVTP